MLKAFFVWCVSAVSVLVLATSTLSAQVLEVKDEDWARAMVDKEMLNINYKSVAKGQDVYFKIRVSNLYNEEMHVTGLSTSCGCLSWDENRTGGSFAAVVIPSGQERFFTLRLDTIRHHGEKKNTKGTITFFEPSKGHRGNATILAEGYIRTDVVLQPGSVNFGSVAPKKGDVQRIVLSYAGRPDWHLLSAKCKSPHLDTELKETSRINNGPASTINYELTVSLKDTAPVGQLRDQLVLTTDDANNPQIPVQVDARIEPEIVITGGDFGSQLIPGRAREIQVIVRTTKEPKKPFKIEKFERTRAQDTIKIKKSDELKTLHQLTLTMIPPNEPGPFEEELFLTISGQTEPITFKARGRILETPAGK